MDKRIKKKIQKWFEDRIAYNKNELKELRKAIKLLEKNKCHYRIHLHSLWANHGEKSVTHNAQPGDGLKKAAKDADKKFMRVNKRSDVQASRFASLIMDNGQTAYVEYPKKKK